MTERIELAFTPSDEARDAGADAAHADVLRQVEEWAAAEPEIERLEIAHMWSSPFRRSYNVEADITWRTKPQQQTLGLTNG